MVKVFNYASAEKLARVFRKHNVKYMFIGKSGAIILGYPDTTQDVDIFPEKEKVNCRAIVSALVELGFPLNKHEREDILKGKDFIQIRKGPFDVDLIFAPDGIEDFNSAYTRAETVANLVVGSLDDIIKSKIKAGRRKDKESIPRLQEFRDWLNKKNNRKIKVRV